MRVNTRYINSTRGTSSFFIYSCFNVPPTLPTVVAKHLRIPWTATVGCRSCRERTVSDARLTSTARDVGHDARHQGVLVRGAKRSAEVVAQSATVNSGIGVVPLLAAHCWLQAVHTEHDKSWLAGWLYCLDACTQTMLDCRLSILNMPSPGCCTDACTQAMLDCSPSILNMTSPGWFYCMAAACTQTMLDCRPSILNMTSYGWFYSMDAACAQAMLDSTPFIFSLYCRFYCPDVRTQTMLDWKLYT